MPWPWVSQLMALFLGVDIDNLRNIVLADWLVWAWVSIIDIVFYLGLVGAAIKREIIKTSVEFRRKCIAGLNGVPQFLTTFGILGTFAGLTKMLLNGVKFEESNKSVTLVLKVSEAVQGAGLALFTSMLGISYTIILVILIGTVEDESSAREKESRLEEKISAISKTLVIMQGIINSIKVLRDGKDDPKGDFIENLRIVIGSADSVHRNLVDLEAKLKQFQSDSSQFDGSKQLFENNKININNGLDELVSQIKQYIEKLENGDSIDQDSAIDLSANLKKNINQIVNIKRILSAVIPEQPQ